MDPRHIKENLLGIQPGDPIVVGEPASDNSYRERHILKVDYVCDGYVCAGGILFWAGSGREVVADKRDPWEIIEVIPGDPK